MMKKFFAMMLAATMVFAGSMSAYAAESVAEEATEALELNWADVEAEVAANEAWAGEMVTFDALGLQMYIPNAFEAAEITEDDAAAGYVAYYDFGDGAAMSVTCFEGEEGLDLGAYSEMVAADETVTNVVGATINGLPGMIYTFVEEEVETAVASFVTDQSYIIEFAFAPTNIDEVAAVSQVLMASIQAAA